MSINTRINTYDDKVTSDGEVLKGLGTFASTLSNNVKGHAPRNDVIAADVRVYLEGIEVPFSDAHVSEPYRELPVASISMPPFTGLTEIGRNYFPKIHIFYRDTEMERFFIQEGIAYEEEDLYRLKFAGVIHRYSYTKLQGPSNTQQSMQFHCVHKYYVLNELLIKFGAKTPEGVSRGGADQANHLSSYFGTAGMVHAITRPIKPYDNAGTGVESLIDNDTKDKSTVDITVVPEYLAKYYGRVQGIPGYLVNMWNAMRLDAYSDREMAKTMTDMYIPVIEDGVKFFQRMTGHPYVEGELAQGVPAAASTSRNPAPDGTASQGNGYSVVPPMYRNSVGAAASADFNITSLGSILNFRGEQTSMMDIFDSVINNLRYDKVTLGSPVQAEAEDWDAVDTIIKPLMPTYYSPTCNVILPAMITSLSVEESYYDIPTRSSSTQHIPQVSGEESRMQEYRTPHLYRKAVAATQHNGNNGGNLRDTLAFYTQTFGSHEEGRGVKAKHAQIENWVQLLSGDLAVDARQSAADEAAGEAAKNHLPYEAVYDKPALDSLALAWHERNRPRGSYIPEYLDKLNPWSNSEDTGLDPYQRNILNAIDYDFALTTAQSRVGRVSMVFNPHIVPGYPCEIISKNFSDPSYHAFVTSVDTSFSGSGNMSTSVSFTSAFTYDELLHYELPGSQPWLSHKLSLTENPNLASGIKSNTAKDFTYTDAHNAAEDYYSGVLGVGFANPDALYDFKRGRGRVPQLAGVGGSILYGQDWPERVAGDLNTDPASAGLSAVSTEGSLALIRREIETMADVYNTGNQSKFVHMERETIDSSSGTRTSSVDPATSAVDSVLAQAEYQTIQDYYSGVREVGKSAFLKYSDDPA